MSSIVDEVLVRLQLLHQRLEHLSADVVPVLVRHGPSLFPVVKEEVPRAAATTLSPSPVA